MSDKVIRWTSIFMQRGLGPVEARKRAIKRVKFEQDIDKEDTKLNTPVKGI